MHRNARAATLAAVICIELLAGGAAHAAFPGDTGDLAWSKRLAGEPAHQIHRW